MKIRTEITLGRLFRKEEPLRFIYLKSGLHPVSIVSKEETDAFKKLMADRTNVMRNISGDEASAFDVVAGYRAEFGVADIAVEQDHRRAHTRALLDHCRR